MSSLYVHIPFCKSICAYCDFPKVMLNEGWAFSYLSALFLELEQFSSLTYDTIYVGGGTPTSLPLKAFDRLLNKLSTFRKNDTEFSIETNPDSLSDEKLDLCCQYGVNRISIGMESSAPRLLSLMKRTHSYQDVLDAVRRAKEHKIDNVNVDLIYALPSETEEELNGDINRLIALNVPHLSAYSLTVSPGTLFYLKGYKEADQEIAARQYELILHSLRQKGYDRYEVSNFALKGYECKHNLTYWKDEHYDAIGLGASGYTDDVRYSNTKNLNKYLRGEFRESEEKILFKGDLEYYFLTNLRLEEGFSLLDFRSRFGFSFFSRYEKEFSDLSKRGLLALAGNRIKPTDQGILLLDRILLTLFP